MEVTLKVKILAGDIYDYLLYHYYTSAAGLIGSCVGALLVVSAFLTGTWIYLVVGLIILLYLPWVSFLKSRTQAKTRHMSNHLTARSQSSISMTTSQVLKTHTTHFIIM